MSAMTVRLTEYVPQRGVRRTGAALLYPDRVLRDVDEHLRVRLSTPPPMPLLADVLVAGLPSVGLHSAGHPPHEEPARYAAGLADGHPGALVVAVYRGPCCWLRFGGRPRLLVHEPGWPLHPWAVWASVAHVWLVAGLDPYAFDPAVVRVVRTVRGYGPPESPPRKSSDVAGPEASGAGSTGSASGGSSASSRVRASSASADRDRPAEVYRDSALR